MGALDADAVVLTAAAGRFKYRAAPTPIAVNAAPATSSVVKRPPPPPFTATRDGTSAESSANGTYWNPQRHSRT
jgi:hypothetical protein